MAAKGYHLCEGYAFQGGYAYFLTGEPATVRYRIDAARKVRQSVFGIIDEALPPEEEVQQLHRDMGWEFVTVRGQFLIYVCRDPLSPPSWHPSGY